MVRKISNYKLNGTVESSLCPVSSERQVVIRSASFLHTEQRHFDLVVLFYAAAGSNSSILLA